MMRQGGRSWAGRLDGVGRRQKFDVILRHSLNPSAIDRCAGIKQQAIRARRALAAYRRVSLFWRKRGRSSVVEHQLPKLKSNHAKRLQLLILLGFPT
jgi:hypothetical protein